MFTDKVSQQLLEIYRVLKHIAVELESIRNLLIDIKYDERRKI